MSWDIVGGRYGMLMDVMSMTASQSPSGEIQRAWAVTSTNILCYARGLKATGTRLSGIGENWGTVYDDVNTIKIHTPFQLRKDQRVTNIRDPQNNVVWYEPNGVATVFDVSGSNPVMDPFNSLIEWDALLMRATPQ